MQSHQMMCHVMLSLYALSVVPRPSLLQHWQSQWHTVQSTGDVGWCLSTGKASGTHLLPVYLILLSGITVTIGKSWHDCRIEQKDRKYVFRDCLRGTCQ